MPRPASVLARVENLCPAASLMVRSSTLYVRACSLSVTVVTARDVRYGGPFRVVDVRSSCECNRPVGVEKVCFLQNSQNFGDRQCLGKLGKSFAGLPDAILILRILR